MREKRQKQIPLSLPFRQDFDQAGELEAISRILDKHPAIYGSAYQDLCPHGARVKNTGADGMSAEQVLRTAIVKVLFG